MNKESKKVAVAMSGGVDSSFAAALLKKQGYQVTGIFVRFWKEPRPDEDLNGAELNGSGRSHCSVGSEEAARAVAEKLKIPFCVLDLEKEFKREVVDYFLAEQSAGRTPNPCVICNKKIKFGLLFKKALELGTDYLATGHYACLQREIPNSKFQNLIKFQKAAPKLQARLFVAKDKSKDQSYFLYRLGQKQLSRIIFPLADYVKEDVIKQAKKWRLPCQKEQSFDLCFVANSVESFIKRYLKLRSGPIADLKGNILGVHGGLALYTIGQRKRLPVARGPWWVVKKDEKKNALYVSNVEKDLYGEKVTVDKVYWMAGKPKLPSAVLAKIRYKSEAARAQIHPCSISSSQKGRKKMGELLVVFEKPQRAITPGQSVVFYTKKGEVLGGGIIVI